MDAQDSGTLPVYPPTGDGALLRVQIEDLPAFLPRLQSELKRVFRIDLLRGDEVIAEIRPREPLESTLDTPPEMPDFMARLKQMWGDRVFEDSTPLIRADRDAR